MRSGGVREGPTIDDLLQFRVGPERMHQQSSRVVHGMTESQDRLI